MNLPMRSSLQILIIAASLLLFGCNKTENKIIEKVVVDTKNPETLSISFKPGNYKLFDLSEFDTFLGEIEKICVYKDDLIIYDGQLRLFNYDSKKVIDLSKKGKGPNEYITVSAIRTAPDGVYFIDRRSRKLNKVNFNGGLEFSIDIDSNPSDFLLLNDSMVVFFHGSFPIKDKLYRTSIFNINSRKHTDYQISYPKSHLNYFYFEDWNNFSHYNKSIKLRFSGSNEIYYMDSMYRIKPILYFDFGDNTKREELFKRNYSEVYEFVEDANKMNVLFRVISFYETSKYYISTTFINKDWYIYIYNKTTKATKFYNKIKLGDYLVDITYDIIPKGLAGEYLVFILEPTFLDENKIDLTSMNIGNAIINNLDYTSNPIILLINENSLELD